MSLPFKIGQRVTDIMTGQSGVVFSARTYDAPGGDGSPDSYDVRFDGSEEVTSGIDPADLSPEARA